MVGATSACPAANSPAIRSMRVDQTWTRSVKVAIPSNSLRRVLGKISRRSDSATKPDSALGQDFVPAMAPNLPDELRGPFEIVFPQLLAYHLSLASDLDPDCPSPDGVITRVVQPFSLH